MKEKGFTLIELLAVIVILAIIALIATPIILSIIEDTRNSSKDESVKLYLDTLKKSIVSELATDPKFDTQYLECGVNSDSSAVCNYKNIKVEISGNTPISGRITIENGKIISAINLQFKNDDNIYKFENNKLVLMSLDELTESCFVSLTQGEISVYDTFCPKNIKLSKNLELPVSTVKQSSFNKSKCMAYAASYLDVNDIMTEEELCDFIASDYEKADTATKIKVGDVTFERTKDKYKISKIGNSAFSGNGITNIELSDNIVEIGANAFSRNRITNIELSDNIVEIGVNAFAGNNLTSVKIPNSITSIEESAFEDNNLTSIEIPNSVTSIGNYAFENNKLTNVIIPDSITNIGDSAFSYNRLTSVTVPKNLTTMGYYIFSNNKMSTVKISDGIKEIGFGMFYKNNIVSVEFPSSIVSINSNAFAYNKITSVSIPDSVTRIKDNAFNYNNITSVEIGSGIEYLGQKCFYNDKEVDENNNITYGPNEIKVFKIHKVKDENIFKINDYMYRSVFIGSDGNSNSNIIWDS